MVSNISISQLKAQMLLVIVVLASVVLLCVQSYALADADSMPTIRYIDPEYAADFSDDRVLVGASHNIFAGTVVEQVGTKERGLGPETQFEVRVVDNLKGHLEGTVVVNQEGGLKNGTLYAFGEENAESKISGKEDYLLQPGSTYIFATRYSEQNKWYTLNPYPTAKSFIASKALDDTSIKILLNENSRYQELARAYSNEILLKADVYHKNTPNSYGIQEKFTEVAPSDISTEDKVMQSEPAAEATTTIKIPEETPVE